MPQYIKRLSFKRCVDDLPHLGVKSPGDRTPRAGLASSRVRNSGSKNSRACEIVISTPIFDGRECSFRCPQCMMSKSMQL